MKQKTNGKSLPIILLCLILAFASFLLSSVARTTRADTTTITGKSFVATETYISEKRFTELPKTYEMRIKVPQGYSSSAGTIYGNYRAEYNWCDEGISFMVNESGNPRIFLDNGSTVYDIIFNANLATGEWKHLSFAIDTDNGTAECFVDGVSVEKKTAFPAGIVIKNEVCSERAFMIGSDYRRYNPEYFKGEIASVAVFSDLRTDTEILADMQGVDNATDGLLAKYDLSSVVDQKIPDLTGNGYNVSERVYLNSEEYERVDDFAYSFAVIGDTQSICEDYESDYINMYKWIVDNAQNEKIQYVFGLGDITEQSKVVEWNRAKMAFAQLDAAKIPYSIIRGNHDMKTDNPDDLSRKGMNSVFANKVAYTSQFDGFYAENDITNSWRTFKVGETDYLFVTLDYGASDDMLDWASEIIESHPKHKVIITTHGYLFGTGKKCGEVANRGTPAAASNDYEYKKNPNNTNVRDYNTGYETWNILVRKYGNICMVMSGHEGADEIIYTRDIGDHGNQITNLMINPQGADDTYKSLGMVALLKFSADGSKMWVEYYSTVKKQYFMEINQFSLDMSTAEYSAHSIGRYKLVSEATCTKNAVMEGTCADCGKKIAEEIPDTMHKHSVATYTVFEQARVGVNAKASGICKLCGETVIREIPNSALLK